jgi:acyl-CoA synthetase (AMP-forming)/AMP-acid ligase II
MPVDTREPLNGLESLVDLLERRAGDQPDERAYIFLSDRGSEEACLTFSELDRRARELAARLAERAQAGDRALLLFPAGLDFIVAFFACLRAGLIAVPTMVPRRRASRDSGAAILADCAPRLALTNIGTAAARPDVVERCRAAGIEPTIIDRGNQERTAPDATPPIRAAGRHDVAFLQYTSGSTSTPKGVVVSHANLLENLEMVRLALGNNRQSVHACWLPLHHDMGLILNVLQSLHVGATCVLLSPTAFLQRPLTWLRAIHDYRVEVAGGPNFAFDLCVNRFNEEQMAGIDLSCWKIAVNAAEPVQADTIERFVARFAAYGFDTRTMDPGYGLAEATVGVSLGSRGRGVVTRAVSRDALLRNQVSGASSPGDRRVIVGCGRSMAAQRIAIVDPHSRRRIGSDRIGEVWVSGANVARGYWQKADATATVFGACIADEAEACWLRTGDLGFLDEGGELYITGRLKDVIIIRGMNHYPQDIESTVQGCNPALRRNCGAAFAVPDPEGEEKLVIVQEVERTHRNRSDIAEVVGDIREAVVNEHEVAVDTVVLISPGTIPRTTSGKIQRNLTRALWLQGALQVLE